MILYVVEEEFHKHFVMLFKKGSSVFERQES